MKRTEIKSLEFRNLGFGYIQGENVFSKLNYHFPAGEVLFLHSTRGGGKHTLLKLLMGMLSPTEGHYFINGINVNDFSHQEFYPYRLNMGHSFDVGGLINNQTLYENFRFVMDYHNFLEPRERFDYIVKLMARFQLEDIKHLRPAFVSSSARKAACVLRAFILKPQILIMDNPTQGLSIEHVPALVDLIQDHQKQHGLERIIISSDDSNLMHKLKGKVMTLTSTGLINESNLESVA